MDRRTREDQWSAWMRAAIAGDASAYRRLLEDLTPQLRAAARRRVAAFGGSGADLEDAVQDVLIAIHLKRGTWDPTRPIAPWIAAILRHKLVDHYRRRGRNVAVPLDDIAETLGENDRDSDLSRVDIDRMLARLKKPQQDIVRMVSLDGQSVRAVAEKLKMSEVAVRVALHRAIRTLGTLFRSEDP